LITELLDYVTPVNV